MNCRLLLASCVLSSTIISSVSHAQLVESTFATDADGWLSVTLPYPSAIPPTIVATFFPVWNADLGGYISLIDPDGTTTGNTEYWQAPAKFLGAQSVAYGGTLSFDLANPPGFGLFDQEDIILLGGGLTLVYDLGTPPGGNFVHYSIPMSEGGWTRDGLAGPAATQTEFLTALSNITQIFIRAEFQLGEDTEYLDNVVLSGPVTAVDGVLRGLALTQNVPNPFNPSTRIALLVDRDSAVRVDVYDVQGYLVRRLLDGRVTRGEHQLEWDGRDSRGQLVTSGVYYCRVTSGSNSVVRKMVLLK
jgi:hypothetical protein